MSTGRTHAERWALFLLIACFFSGCKQRAPLDAIPDDSLYQLESVWETQNGAAIRLRDLSGPVQIVGLVFTHCGAICPTLVLDMKSIQQHVGWLHRRNVKFLLVSIDPERDTPEEMRNYMSKMGLDSDIWTFIRSKPEDLSDLASLLGVKIAPLPEGGFSHTRIITVLGPEGRIQYQDARVSENAANFTEAAANALK